MGGGVTWTLRDTHSQRQKDVPLFTFNHTESVGVAQVVVRYTYKHTFTQTHMYRHRRQC